MRPRLLLPHLRWSLVLLAPFALACVEEAANAPLDPPPQFDVEVSANAANVLSGYVTLRAPGADSVRVEYTLAGGPTAVTPSRAVTGGRDTVLVLGLRPDTAYAVSAIVYGPTGMVRSDARSFRTAPLPAGLADLQMSITGTPTPGYLVTALMPGGGTGYVVAFDSSGAVGWYRGFTLDAGELVTDVHRWPNGNYTVFLGASTGWQPVAGAHLEITPGGDVVRTYRAPAPYYTDNHELHLDFQDTTITGFELFGYTLRATDLTPVGGPASSLVAGHQVLRMTPSGAVDFFWNGWDYLKVTDWIEKAGIVALNPIDFDHPNSLDVAPDGNYLVSWRHLSEVNKIQARTGRLMWRLGGVNNQFTFVGDPEQGFSGQHYARMTSADHLLLFDNGISHAAPESRVVEYQLDEVNHVATMVWEYRHTPAYLSPTRGSVDRLVSGNSLIGWATLGRVEEVTPERTSVWEGAIHNAQGPVIFYRAFRTPSLYRYAAP